MAAKVERRAEEGEGVEEEECCLRRGREVEGLGVSSGARGIGLAIMQGSAEELLECQASV